jgi:tungstate transport system ATP-binding protein
VLELIGVRHRFDGREVLAVDRLGISPGERLAVVGHNGAGKSTLLRLLGLLEWPTEGRILLDGRALDTEAHRRSARRRVTVVEQRPYLFAGTVADNVAFGARLRIGDAHAARQRALDALAGLGSEVLADRPTSALSEGEVQRVAVARALAADPEYLLLDEPATGADRGAVHSLYAAIAEAQAARGLAVVVASHLLEDAYRWADRIVALSAGVVTPVSPENLFRVRLPGGGDMQRVSVGGLAIDVVTDRAGNATLAIPADEIVLSPAPLSSSARNSIEARIVRVSEQGAAVRVALDCGGVELVSLVTRKSFEELGLKLGGRVFASFKSVAVRVF